MVFKTEYEAAIYVADVMKASRAECLSVMMTVGLTNMESFANTIFNIHPELIACIENLSMQVMGFGIWQKIVFNVVYTEVMPSAVSVIDQISSLQDEMLFDVKLHRRSTELAFPNGLEEKVQMVIKKLTETPQFLDCFLKGTTVWVRRKPGCDYMSLQVKYVYSCSYEEYRRRLLQMKKTIAEIVKLAKSNGSEDWKKAFYVVKYCVNHWSYGSVEGLPGLEFSSYGALVRHTAVCMGIALAVCAVFSELGIPCRYIRGQRDGVGHAWNLVFLCGGWFYIDVTDAIGNRNPFYHWGMTSLEDRCSSEPIDVTLKCSCPEAFLKANGMA